MGRRSDLQLQEPVDAIQNGLDFHLDWGASHFFNQKYQLGLVGYYLQQVSDDLGTPPALDGFRARIAAIGPQVGFLFPLGDMQGYST